MYGTTSVNSLRHAYSMDSVLFFHIHVQGRSVNRDMDIRSDCIFVQNLLSTDRNGVLLSKIDWIIVQEYLLIVQNALSQALVIQGTLLLFT